MVVVVGSPRSGTSVAARALIALGVDFGENFNDPGPENPTGFWEDLFIDMLNDRLLAAAGSHLSSVRSPDLGLVPEPLYNELLDEATEYARGRLARSELWGFKDPRATRVLPFWQTVFERVGAADAYVILLRHPAAVGRSTGAGPGDPEAVVHELRWVDYMLAAVRATAGRPRVVTRYDRLLESPAAELDRIAGALELEAGGAEAAAASLTGGFLDASLRHSNDAVEADPDHRATRELYTALVKVAHDETSLEDAAVASLVEAIAAEVGGADGYLRDYAAWADHAVRWSQETRDGLEFWLATAEERARLLDEKEGIIASLREDAARARTEAAEVSAEVARLGHENNALAERAAVAENARDQVTAEFRAYREARRHRLADAAVAPVRRVLPARPRPGAPDAAD